MRPRPEFGEVANHQVVLPLFVRLRAPSWHHPHPNPRPNRCLGLLLGVEQVVMPLFDVSAVALSTLIFSGRRGLTAYMVSG